MTTARKASQKVGVGRGHGHGGKRCGADVGAVMEKVEVTWSGADGGADVMAGERWECQGSVERSGYELIK